MSRGFLGRLIDVFGANKTSWVGLVLFAAICVIALLAPWIAGSDPLEQSIIDKLQPPSATHWFGTDEFGRDVYARLVWGARISLIVSISAITIALVEIGRAHV
jgi:peptide/nickel transport system permease protein